MHIANARQPQSRHQPVESVVRRLALSSAFLVPALVAPMLAGVGPAYAQCVTTGTNIVCSGSVTTRVGTGVEDDISLTVLQSADINVGGALDAIFLDDNTSVTNNGTIIADDDGVDAGNNLKLINNGTITAASDGILVNSIATLTNNGSIHGDGDGITVAGIITLLTNNGTISGGDDGFNVGTINALSNNGSIRGGDDGIAVGNLTALTNSGTVSGGTYAIREFGAADTTLTLNAGSVLIGRVDLGGGSNTLNIGAGLSLNSTFESNGGATLVTLGTTAGHLVALVPVPGGGANNDVEVVAVDPSAFANFDDALAALTAGVGGVVQGRQSALRSDPSLGFASRYAAAQETSLAAFSDLDLDAAPHLHPNRFWIEGFGAYREDESDRVGSTFESLTGGLVAGVDVPLDALTSVGAMAGFAASTSQNEIDTQETDTRSYYAGVYALTEALGLAWDASLTVGHTSYDAERITANNLVASGLETARADFGGWFINPQVTATNSIPTGFTSTTMGFGLRAVQQSLTLSYAGLFLDDYTETGTTNPLTLDARALHLASARAALALPFEAIHADGALTTLRLIGGIEARTQFGDDRVSGRLLGQTVATTLDDDDATFGGFLGLSGEYQTTSGLTAYANAEGLLETNSAYQISATAGLRVAF